MPSFVDVGRIVEYDQALNDCSDQEAHTGQIDLPTDSREPAYGSEHHIRRDLK